MNKYFYVIPFVLLFAACTRVEPIPEPTIISSPTVAASAIPEAATPTASSVSATLKTYMHTPTSTNGLNKKFTVKYPASWSVKAINESDTGATIQITNTVYTISIVQGILDGGYCLYPSDADQQGMFIRYGNYMEISKQAGKKWRVAPLQAADSNPVAYEVCQSDRGIDGFYGNVTEIGPISIRGIKRGESLPAEVAQILRDITF